MMDVCLIGILKLQVNNVWGELSTEPASGFLLTELNVVIIYDFCYLTTQFLHY